MIPSADGELDSHGRHEVGRRSFLKGLGMAGAALLPASALSMTETKANRPGRGGRLTKGDAAILRFLAAAEILESDLWQQYNELGGIQDSEVPGGSGSPAYTKALAVLDEDMDQYIHDNTEDEISHFTFINAYLASKGEDQVNLDQFRTLPSSKATGAQQIGRLTNLMQLTVDTSWWTRYRSRTKNPDFGRLPFPKQSRVCLAGSFRRFQEAMPISPPLTTFKRSPTRQDFTSRLSSKVAPASIHRLLRE